MGTTLRSVLILFCAIVASDGLANSVDLDAEDELELATGNTCYIPSGPLRVVYNRVAKAGSVTMLAMIMVAAKSHAFHIHHQAGTFPPLHTRELYEAWVKLRLSDPAPYIYDAHMWFADISPMPAGLLTWINIVREPAKLFSSMFYYQRDCTCGYIASCKGGVVELRHLPRVIPHYCRMTLDQAWAQWNQTFAQPNLKFFFPGPGILVDIFCGVRDPVCYASDMRAKYAIARRRVARDFLVVGTLERLHDSLRLVQHLLPAFFYNMPTDTFANLRTNSGAKHLDVKPSLNTIRELKVALQWDQRLYQFIARRFENKIRACGIPNRTRLAELPRAAGLAAKPWPPRPSPQPLPLAAVDDSARAHQPAQARANPGPGLAWCGDEANAKLCLTDG